MGTSFLLFNIKKTNYIVFIVFYIIISYTEYLKQSKIINRSQNFKYILRLIVYSGNIGRISSGNLKNVKYNNNF